MEQQITGMSSTNGSDGSLADRGGAPGFTGGGGGFSQPVNVVGPQTGNFDQPNERGVDHITIGQPAGTPGTTR